MNILHTECSLNWGGQELRTVVETDWLNANGHRAWIACDPRSEMFRRGKEMGAPVVPVSLRGSVDPRGIAALTSLLAKNRIDLINTHGSKDSWNCLPFHLLGKPVVRSRHLTLAVKPGLQRSFIYRHGCRRVIATAAVIRKALIEVNKVRPKKIEVVGEFVEFCTFHPGVSGAPFREEFGIGNAAPLIGIVGMIRGEKGHRFFLDAAFEVLKTHPHARFILVGEGTEARKTEKECRRRIEKAFANHEPAPILMTDYRSNVAEAIAALDIVVVPSLAEAQSRIVPEAFAMRRAVIASNVGGLPELVRDGETGLLVPPKDGSSLAKAIIRLIDDPALRETLAANGHAFAISELSLDKKMAEILAVYERAMR